MNVRLHIERLVIEGASFGPGGGRALQAALEAELTRLLAQGSLAPAFLAGGALPSIEAAPILASATRKPGQLGTEIARAVHAGLKDPGTV